MGVGGSSLVAWIGEGERDDEFATLPKTGTRGLNRPAMHLGQRFGKRQTDAQAAVRAFVRCVGLSKEAEDALQHFWLDANAVVTHVYHGALIDKSDVELDFAAWWSVFSGIDEQ